MRLKLMESAVPVSRHNAAKGRHLLSAWGDHAGNVGIDFGIVVVERDRLPRLKPLQKSTLLEVSRTCFGNFVIGSGLDFHVPTSAVSWGRGGDP